MTEERKPFVDWMKESARIVSTQEHLFNSVIIRFENRIEYAVRMMGYLDSPAAIMTFEIYKYKDPNHKRILKVMSTSIGEFYDYDDLRRVGGKCYIMEIGKDSFHRILQNLIRESRAENGGI